PAMAIHRGGCHCGRVRFEVEAPENMELLECNCSMCRKVGYLHLIVRRAHFRLVSGEEVLASYQFNTGPARYLFSQGCGVQSSSVPRSRPGGYCISARCRGEGTVEMVTVTPFAGRDWEAAAEDLEPLPQE